MSDHYRLIAAAMAVLVLFLAFTLTLAIDRKNELERVNNQTGDYVKLCAMVADDHEDFETCIRVAEGGSADE